MTLSAIGAIVLLVTSPRLSETFGGIEMLKPDAARPLAVVPPPTSNEITHLMAVSGISGNATGYEFTVWTSTHTNVIRTNSNVCRFTVTNLLDDRVFATVTATNDWGDADCPKVAHWPPYPADRMTITAVSGSPVPLETSINLKQWSASGSTPLTVSFIGSRRYYRAKGLTNSLVMRAFNPLNE